MSRVQNHINQWTHNRSLLEKLEPAYVDWIVTAAFYAALHAVDALLALDKVENITCHVNRNSALIQINKYKKINECYSPLYGLSMTVRYFALPNKWVPYEKIVPNIFGGLLYPLERSVVKLLHPHHSVSLPDINLRPQETK